jgi:hypothetical protein
MLKRLTWKASSPICLRANIAARFAWSPSTPHSAGQKMFRKDATDELRRRCDLQMRELHASISDFVEQHETQHQRLMLRLV